MNHSDRVIVMAEGRVIADGEPHEVRADQEVIDAYLGGGGASENGGPRRVSADEHGAEVVLRPRTWSPATCPRSTSSTASRSRSARARSSPSSGPTAPASRP